MSNDIERQINEHAKKPEVGGVKWGQRQRGWPYTWFGERDGFWFGELDELWLYTARSWLNSAGRRYQIDLTEDCGEVYASGLGCPSWEEAWASLIDEAEKQARKISEWANDARERNTLMTPEHTLSEDCWCEPDVESYEGGDVIIHRETH